ncbi:MAG: type II toxin-antitoxin system PemK/MazF family toxin [Clostridia bacterium]|nr:type II toxin-antitoxin system PemK/MazF family toxin [Clostridia bacterium]
MDYRRIFDKVDEMVKENFSKEYRLKVLFNQENDFNGFTQLSIELVKEDGINEVVYNKTLKEINAKIKEVGCSKFLIELRVFLGKIVRKTFSRGDLFWAENDFAQANLEMKRRPYIIVSNNANNNFSPLLTVVPVTTQEKRALPTHIEIEINGVKCWVLCEQITCIQKTDLLKYIRSLSKEEFAGIEQGMRVQLALNKKQEKIQTVENACVETTKVDVKKENWIVRMFNKIFKRRKNK